MCGALWKPTRRASSQLLLLLLLPLGLSVGCGGSGGPTAPTPAPTTTSISVVFPAGETIFIGNDVQFEARETLSDGTTRVATSATWESDNPTVATVSSTGLVTAVAAGEATISAAVNLRGILRVRVFPEVQGEWLGSWIVESCIGTGAFAGGCSAAGFRSRAVFPLEMTYTQSAAAVDGIVALGSFTPNSGSGSISIGGELLLTFPSAPGSAFGGFVFRLRPTTWRARADTPGNMTGAFRLEVNVDGFAGGYQVDGTLRNANLQGSSVSTPMSDDSLQRLADYVYQLDR